MVSHRHLADYLSFASNGVLHILRLIDRVEQHNNAVKINVNRLDVPKPEVIQNRGSKWQKNWQISKSSMTGPRGGKGRIPPGPSEPERGHNTRHKSLPGPTCESNDSTLSHILRRSSYANNNAINVVKPVNTNLYRRYDGTARSRTLLARARVEIKALEGCECEKRYLRAYEKALNWKWKIPTLRF